MITDWSSTLKNEGNNIKWAMIFAVRHAIFVIFEAWKIQDFQGFTT